MAALSGYQFRFQACSCTLMIQHTLWLGREGAHDWSILSTSPKNSASARYIDQWQEQQATMSHTWWQTVLIPAIDSLPPTTRTRRFNTTSTFLTTNMEPQYLRVYNEDVPHLDRVMANTTSPMNVDLDWFFLCVHYGQRQLLKEGEELGPHAFGLGSVFDLSNCCRFSAHLALNIDCTDPSYSLFWDARYTARYTAGAEAVVSLCNFLCREEGFYL